MSGMMKIWETMMNKVSKIMGFVRCFAKKYGNIGIFDYYSSKLISLCLSKSDKDLYVLIENYFDSYGNYIVPLIGYGEGPYLRGNKLFFTPYITFDVERNTSIYRKNFKSIVLNIRKPVLLLEYLNGEKCAYGISEYGNTVTFTLDLETSTIDDFKKYLDKIE